MKKTIFLLYALLIGMSTYAQTPWYVVGNPGSSTDWLGTSGNWPVRCRTNAIDRMKINSNLNYSINGFNAARNGFVLLGISNNSLADGQNIYTQKGAFSLLHLNGEGSVFQEFGYRPWMRPGITFTANSDLSYVGPRKLSTNPAQEDLTEMTIAWSDNALAPNPGPDDMVFRFIGLGTQANAVTNTVSTNMELNDDLDGLHVARFTGEGRMGLGNTFGLDATGMAVGYVRPQSLFHMSLNGTRNVWSQYTNREPILYNNLIKI